MSHDILSGFSLVLIVTEVDLTDQEVADGPDPLRSLMIVMTARLIVVVVVALVLGILGIQCLDAHRTFRHEDFFNYLETSLSLRSDEELWGDGHGNAEIWSKLVISVAPG